MTSLLAVIWFGWPISLALATSISAVSLLLRAARNQMPRVSKYSLTAGVVAVFIVPASAMALGTDIGCSDGDPSIRFRVPGLVLVAAVAAGLLGLWRLESASGPADRRWVLPAALLGTSVVGFLLESFLTLAAFYEYCDESSSLSLLYVQGGSALIVSAVCVAAGALKARLDA